MQSCQFVTTITALACAIAQCVPSEDSPLLASAFSQLGDTLATISAHQEKLTDTKSQ